MWSAMVRGERSAEPTSALAIYIRSWATGTFHNQVRKTGV
jgi:hypothetical protein